MAGQLILETTFLIDLERERSAPATGACVRFLAAQGSARLYICHTTAGELACGVGMADRSRWEGLVTPFHILSHTIDVDWHYAQAFRHLRRRGELIAANDLWIAATALAYRMPVVTRNVAHFERVPGLDVLAY
jgi:predicted nucleic acid-binding protein